MRHFVRCLLLLQVYACLLQPLQVYAAVPAQTPLFLAARPDPNVLFALSVEFPTAETAAYSDIAGSDPASLCPGQTSDNAIGAMPVSSSSTTTGICYYETQTYLGYFDAAKCYQYSISNGYFVASALATPSNHECGGAWSGNMLNWATMTAIDETRWAMTGGNRDIDTAATSSSAALTVLKRAVKARGPNDSYFVVKRLTLSATSVSGSTVPGVATSKVTPYNGNITLYFANTGTTLTILSSTAATSGNSPNPALGAIGDALESTLPSGSVSYGSGSNKINTLAALQVRVKVCDASSSAVSLESNCSGYPNTVSGATSYKPSGLIQQYASAMRFAVSSYLYDSNSAHNGGVLRSNMKYVGPVTKDPVNGVTTNTAAEWTTDGVFIQNPNASDASASGITCTGGAGCSGVVNYLNQFGYYASDYMKSDVVSELYYESLRYFAVPANGPTNAYVSAPWNGGLDASEKDGFPVLTKWADPIQYACQPNAIVTVGDANTWCDANLPGSSSLLNDSYCPGHNNYTYNTSETWGNAGVPSVANWTNIIGANEPAVGNNGSLGAQYGNKLQGTFYIAGLAWWAHTHDIRKDVATQSSTLGVQSVSSYFVDVREPGSWGSGGPAGPTQYWMAAKYGGFTIPAGALTASSGTLLPTPAAASDWTDDGVTPRNYLYANNPTLLVSSLTTLFGTINSATATQASLAANSTSLQSGDKVFQGKATTSDWSGDLVAYDVSARTCCSPLSRPASPSRC